MDEQKLTAAICTASALAANYRYARAVSVLEGAELPSPRAALHPDLLRVNADLGWWKAWSGQLHTGLDVLTATAQAMSQANGIEPQHTLATRARVAYLTGMVGDATSASAQFAELAAAVSSMEMAVTPLGLHIRRQQARWLGTSGRLPEALAVLDPLLKSMKIHLGEGHRETLLCLSNLAYYNYHAGHEQEALHLYASLVDLRSRFLGPMDPETLDARRNQAWVLGQVDAASAVGLLGHLVVDCERVLDSDHRYLITARLDLATLALRTGMADVAREQLLQVVTQALASNDPSSVLSEYGRVDLPASRLQEVLQRLDPNDTDLIAAVATTIRHIDPDGSSGN